MNIFPCNNIQLFIYDVTLQNTYNSILTEHAIVVMMDLIETGIINIKFDINDFINNSTNIR